MKRSFSAFVFVISISCFSSFVLAEDASIEGSESEPVSDSNAPEQVQAEQEIGSEAQEDSTEAGANADSEPDEADVSEASLEGLKALIDGGDYEEAYAQGQDMLFDFEGEREFDLLYGTAANEVGESKEAVFIFERLVEQDPNDLLARLELGKAYYQTGEKEKAQFEFERVLASDQALPDNVEANIAAYLSAIASGSEFGNPAKAEKLKAFIGIAAGHDSNANVASDAKVINAYINGFVFPTANATEAESTTYLEHQLAAAYVKPFNDRTALDMKVFISERKNGSDLSYLDTGNVFFELGNRWRFEKGVANFSLRYSGVTLGDDDLYDFSQFIASWQQPTDWEYADSLSVSFNTGAIRYTADANSSRDINPSSLSLGLNRQIEQFVHAVNLTYGMDDAQGSDEFQEDRNKDGTLETYIITADQYSRNYYGIGYSLNYLYDDKTTYFGVINYQTSSYKEEDHDFFNDQGEWTKRDGDLSSISIGTRYNWNKSLQFRASATMLDVTSKISLYEYSRNTIEVGVGYQL